MKPRKIPNDLLALYEPYSLQEAFYLRARWRLCPFEAIESLVPPSGRILDFGCGYGLLANLLALKSPSRMVYGLDLDEKRISVAKRTASGRSNIIFELAKEASPQAGPYTAVVMTDVMHHMNNRIAGNTLENIHISLEPSGILIVLDVDRRPFWKFFLTYSIDRLLNLPRGLYYRSSSRMKALFKDCSFTPTRFIPAHRGLPLSDVIYLCSPVRPRHGRRVSPAHEW